MNTSKKAAGFLRTRGTGTGRWLGNILYNIKASKAWDQKLFYYQFLPAIPGVTATYLGLLLPARLVQGLEEGWEIQRILVCVLLLYVGMCLLKMADKGMGEYLYRNYPTLIMYYEKLCYGKVMRLDYRMLEEPETAGLMANTWNVLRSEFGFRNALCATPQILGSLAGIGWYGILIARKNYGILLLTLANTLFNTLLMSWLRKKQEKLHKKVGAYSKKTAYINRMSMDRQAGKDIRIYRMTDWFLQKYDRALGDMDSIYRQIHDGAFLRAAGEALAAFLVNGFSYFYLISLLVKGEMSASGFVLYMGLVGSLSGYFAQLMGQLLVLNPVSVSVGYIRQFLALPESMDWSGQGLGAEKLEELKREGIRVDFEQVSYTYPGGEEPVLHQINLTIAPGEKLALIGLNGAGKTTLVKLLCGFYRPDRGRILINGIPASDFAREEYFELISVLFQDSALLPMTLDFNLTGKGAEAIDRKRLTWALKVSGFWEKYQSLPQKGQSLLVREVSGTVDFSGGEKQKLLFARALYKEAPLMILDEPTAALDPIAENEMYLKFDEAAQGRTCLYISHRLSSTRFCDRILLMEQGQVMEEGTHEELMARGGRYRELFEMQSRYYREREEQRRRNAFME